MRNGLTAGVERISSDALFGQMLLQLDCHEHVGCLGLGVRDDAVVAISGAVSKGARERLEVIFFGRDLLALKVVVGETDGREPVPSAAERHDARCAGSVGLGRLAKQGQEEVGEQKRADVVGAKLLLDAFRSRLAGRDNDAGVVYENVELVGQGSHVSGGLTDGFL